MQTVRSLTAIRNAGIASALSRTRLERLAHADPDAAYVLGLVAAKTGISMQLLLKAQRCHAPVAAARQLAMYLVHVMLSRGYAQVGAVFGRDRTTVAHACKLIEDRRDDKQFDHEVLAIERTIEERLIPAERSHAAA